MIELGVIEPSVSPWCSPVVLVPKPDGSIRFCIDFRKLNSISLFDTYPIPRVDDVLEKIGRAKYMSTLDLTKGYWQIPLFPEDKEKTAFSTQSGLYQFTVLPFGLHGAPATFQRLMDHLLKPFSKFAAAYLDDVVIFSNTWIEHLEHLSQVFDTLATAGLTANPKKCMLGKTDISYLGYIIGDGKLRPQMSKIEAISNAPNPKTKKDLRSFLGLVGYYRRFIPAYSTLAAPLTDLLAKSLPNILAPFSEIQRASLDTLRSILTTEPVLQCPDFSKPFHLYTDASNVGLGGVLAQPDQDGRDHPIVFISRKLLPRECHYPIIEKECLAIKFGIYQAPAKALRTIFHGFPSPPQSSTRIGLGRGGVMGRPGLLTRTEQQLTGRSTPRRQFRVFPFPGKRSRRHGGVSLLPGKRTRLSGPGRKRKRAA
ncbi:hypothetical protein NDU88_002948 [Pleurodeles waltl]|uniref:ribonuclease H n=1 Tax=Pleurodeles waltl TaxID=8319 RepID=A0AAV7TN36_PLEWA|nr:hypothetical protein NDU88_002948 [Pleurodeles waltl]